MLGAQFDLALVVELNNFVIVDTTLSNLIFQIVISNLASVVVFLANHDRRSALIVLDNQ